MKGKNTHNRVNGATADNGTEVVTVLTAQEAAETTAQEVTAETVTEASQETPAPYVPPKGRTIAQRLEAFKELEAMTAKRERIEERFNTLATLRRANDAEAVTVEVRANGGHRLEIKHNGLLAEVLDLMGLRLREALTEVETEILNLEV